MLRKAFQRSSTRKTFLGGVLGVLIGVVQAFWMMGMGVF